mmetsp:Transcript_18374/g.27870  ORF Transcript_18374/g.27870 Transcript_18374/m.27870 type:complete len:1083 (-) Transcript_18374:42-3290(-)
MTKNSRKKNVQKRPRQPSKPSFKWCPETREKIWIATVTLTEIKKARKIGENPNAKKKQLVRIPSKITREECYENAARALESKESLMLPTFGGRPWKIVCRFSEPDNNQKSPLFRWFRGELELAVLPHFLEKVTEQATVEQKGKAKLDEDDEEEEYTSSADLSERTESQLSRLAWNDIEHQIPNLNVKWLSPNHQYFYSRKAARDHAKALVEQQLLIDKFIFGYGARGQALRPTKPSKPDALKAGKLRFLRDGLWIVGQEESWQIKHANELEEKRQKEEEAANKRTPDVRKPVEPKTPYQLFIRKQRLNYRKARLRELGSKEDETRTFVLRDADRELGVIWKGSTKEEKQIWIDLLHGKVMTDKERQVWKDRVNGNAMPDFIERTPECSSNNQKLLYQVILNNKESLTSPLPLGQVQSKEMTIGFDLYFREKMSHYPTLEENETKDKGATINNNGSSARAECIKAWENLDPVSKQLWKKKANSNIEKIKILENTNDCQTEPAEYFKVVKVDSQGKRKEQGSLQNAEEINSCIRRSKRPRRLKRQFDEEPDSKSKETNQPVRIPSKWMIPVMKTEMKNINGNFEATDKKCKQEHENNCPTGNDPKCQRGNKTSCSAVIATQIGLSEANDIKCYQESDTNNIPANNDQKYQQGKISSCFEVTARKMNDVSAVADKKCIQGKEGNGLARIDQKLQDENERSCSEVTTTKGKKTAKVHGGENETRKSSSFKLSKALNKPSSHWRLAPEQIQLCHDAAIEHFEKVMITVKARALFAELADGFDLLRERGRGRYDMELPAFEKPEFSFLTDLQKTPWMDVVRQALGDDVVLIHKGVFLSNPGAEAQEYHQDGPHLTEKYQRPCHAVNVFIPLVDLNRRNGPTEFVCGSHILGYDGYDRGQVVTPEVSAGTPIIFDYRLGHRGLANTSNSCRPIVYCTYATAANGKEFRDSANFSRKRYHRLGELLGKPLSRDERLKLRKEAMENRKSSMIKSTKETPSEKKNLSLVSDTSTENTIVSSVQRQNNSLVSDTSEKTPANGDNHAFVSDISRENNRKGTPVQDQIHPVTNGITLENIRERTELDHNQSILRL